MIKSAVLNLNQAVMLQLYCEQHVNKQITSICIDENCQQLPFFCSDCQNPVHMAQCQRYILDIQPGLLQFAEKIEKLAPQSVFSKFFDYFKELSGKESEYIESFTSHVKMQKQKIIEDIDRLKETLASRLDQLKQELQEKLDEQISLYQRNYEIINSLFNEPLGQKYKQIIKLANYKALVKKLNQLETSRAEELLKQLKSDAVFFAKAANSQEYEAYAYKIQEMFLLLNSQSVSPPTYQSGKFASETMNRIKIQFDSLAKKVQELFEQNMHHFPIKNFDLILKEQQELLQSILKTQLPSKPKEQQFLKMNGIRNLVIPTENFNIERGDLKYISLNDDESCVTAMNIINDYILVYALSDSTVHFRSLKEGDGVTPEYDAVQMKTWVYALELITIEEDVEDQMPKGRKLSTRSNKLDAQKLQNFHIALGGEESLIFWKVTLDESNPRSMELYQLQEYKHMNKCTAITSCNDGRNLICGDWEGQIYIIDVKQTTPLFVVDTQTQIIFKLELISTYPAKRVRFVSASRCDMELGGICIWQVHYEDVNKIKDCVMERRIQVTQIVKLIVMKQSSHHLIFANQRSKFFVWDLEKNTMVKKFEGGESQVVDIIGMEFSQKQQSVNSFVVGILNSNTLRFIDHHDTLLSSHNCEDYQCNQCRIYFYSQKLLLVRMFNNIILV